MSRPDATHSAEPNPTPTEGQEMPQAQIQTAAISIPVRPHGCAKCDKRWGGYNTSHCAGCHLTFTGLTAFDKHRDGDHAKSTRRCLPPDLVGLVDAGRDYPCWGFPGDPDRWTGTPTETSLLEDQ